MNSVMVRHVNGKNQLETVLPETLNVFDVTFNIDGITYQIFSENRTEEREGCLYIVATAGAGRRKIQIESGASNSVNISHERSKA